MQGVTQTAHRVKVSLNGSEVGEANFDGQSSHISNLPISQSLLTEGENVVGLMARGSESDVSLIEHSSDLPAQLHRSEHTLRFTAAGKQQVTVDGFTGSSIRVFDVTDPDAVQEVAGPVKPQKNGFAVTVGVPGSGSRTLLAITNDQAQRPSSIAANMPSNWRRVSQSADLVIVAHGSLVASTRLLQAYRENQGLRVALVDIEDVYDEFTFGNKSPYALREFLAFAKSNWQLAPRFVLLVGDASLDPKNYLGRGDFDLVPSKLLDTQFMETASDDWFADIDSSVSQDVSGPLAGPAEDEAARMISKIIATSSRQIARGVARLRYQ